MRSASSWGARHYLFLPGPKVGCQPAPFWLGAAAITLNSRSFGLLASRSLLCSPLAMSTSLDLFVTSEPENSITDAVGNAGTPDLTLRSGDSQRKNISRHRDTRSLIALHHVLACQN